MMRALSARYAASERDRQERTAPYAAAELGDFRRSFSASPNPSRHVHVFLYQIHPASSYIGRQRGLRRRSSLCVSVFSFIGTLYAYSCVEISDGG